MNFLFKSSIIIFISIFILMPKMVLGQEEDRVMALRYAHYFADELIRELAKKRKYTNYKRINITVTETNYDAEKQRLKANINIFWSPHLSAAKQQKETFTISGQLNIRTQTKIYDYSAKTNSIKGRIIVKGRAKKKPRIIFSGNTKKPPNKTSKPKNNKPPKPSPMPQFPWPPPKASAQEELPYSFFKSCTNLRTVDKVLTLALKKSGYRERSYFAVPNGFALVTRIEQINSDASPKDSLSRWRLATNNPKQFTLKGYLKALFTAPKGYFRVISFIITDQAFAKSGQTVRRKEAVHWLSKGFNRLPRSFEKMPFTEDYHCTVLVYEFATQGNSEPVFADPSLHLGHTHLEKSGLLEYLKSFDE